MVDDWEDPWFAPPRRGVDNNPVTPIIGVDSPLNLDDGQQAEQVAQVVNVDADQAHASTHAHLNGDESIAKHPNSEDGHKTNKAVKRGVLWAKPKLQFDWGQPDRHRKVRCSASFMSIVCNLSTVG